jgi:hypothetical protein
MTERQLLAHPQIGFHVFIFAYFIIATNIAILFLASSFGLSYNKIKSEKEAAHGHKTKQI